MNNSEISSLIVSKSKLNGSVKVSGAKNSVLRLMAASILTKEAVILENYPSTLLDAIVHQQMLEVIGKKCYVENNRITIVESDIKNYLKWSKRSIRNTLLILGALTTRTGFGAVPNPGGCNIGEGKGERAYDLHVMILEKLGAKVWNEGEYLCAEAPATGLVGTDIHLPIRSTGATENAILCASLASGLTRVWNPHIRPEILDLITMLNSMGAKIKVYGQEHIEINGVESLSTVNHKVIPDNVEALTWLVGAAVTNGEVEIIDFPFEHLEVPLIFLEESGAKVYRHKNSAIVTGCTCYPLEISTGPYPGINSDMQPILAVYGAKANGQSKYVDLRFPGRYGYSGELNKLGVLSSINGNMLVINGGTKIYGSEVDALDLRAGISLALAGLFAEGETTIKNAWQITRGYDQFEQKMKMLGADIKANYTNAQ